MKKCFKIKYLYFASCFAGISLAFAAIAASGTEEGPGKRWTPEERRARIEQCKADPEKCRAEFLARREHWCKANPQRCRDLQARMDKRAAECKANPDQCRAERQARFEQRFKRADTNGDGRLNRDEVQTAVPRMARHFDAIDANGDGQISKDEIMAARKVRHIQRPRRQESQI